MRIIVISKANDVEPHGHEISADRESVDHVNENDSVVYLDEIKFVLEMFLERTLQIKNANKLANLTKIFLIIILILKVSISCQPRDRGYQL